MERKIDVRRDTKPHYQLWTSLEQKAELEARNGLLQFDEILRLISESTRTPFQLRPSIIQSLHRIAIQDIYTCAGQYRTGGVIIAGTAHEPPAWEEVPRLVEEMCEYVNDNLQTTSAIHLAAYTMWRVNWIHPFNGGNGRTARAVSHLSLCARLGYNLPGTLTIPYQIVAHREPYYAALDAADSAWSKGRLDVGAMEQLLSDMLARQLLEVHRDAAGEKPGRGKE